MNELQQRWQKPVHEVLGIMPELLPRGVEKASQLLNKAETQHTLDTLPKEMQTRFHSAGECQWSPLVFLTSPPVPGVMVPDEPLRVFCQAMVCVAGCSSDYTVSIHSQNNTCAVRGEG
jgi:hypothetical protein